MVVCLFGLGTKLKTVGPKEKEELLQSMKATTKTLEDLLKKDTAAFQAKPKPAAPVPAPAPTPAAPVVVKTKEQKEKERLDRELDMLSGTQSGLQSSTSSLNSSTSSLGGSSSSVTPPAPATTTTTSGSTSLSHLQSLKSTLEQQVLLMHGLSSCLCIYRHFLWDWILHLPVVVGAEVMGTEVAEVEEEDAEGAGAELLVVLCA